MFDFAWSEIALIAAVALIAIGPKDMPVAIKAVTDMIKKARRMAGEFQTHVDEMMRDANLSEVRNSINELRSFDVKSQIEKAVDSDGSLRRTFASNPLETTPVLTTPPPEPGAEAVVLDQTTVAELERPHDVDRVGPAPETLRVEAPAWVPPNLVPPAPASDSEPEAPAFIPPAFIPSGAVLQRRARS